MIKINLGLMCLLHECHFLGVITTCTLTNFFKNPFSTRIVTNKYHWSLHYTIWFSDFKNNFRIMFVVSH